MTLKVEGQTTQTRLIWSRAQSRPYNLRSATLARCATGHDRPESVVTMTGIRTKDNRKSNSVVLYARVSTERQARKDLSIPDQLERMHSYARSKDLQVAGEYIEEGRSATADNRPVFQEMMHRVMNGPDPISAIVVHSFSRAFRNVTDLAIYLRELKVHGVRLSSVTQDVDDSPIGKFVTLFYGLVDEMNSAENSKHVQRTRRENARRGFFNGSKPPYGYGLAETKVIGHTGHRKVLVIDEDESAIVREIFDLYEGIGAQGPMGIKTIVKHLNEKCLYRGQKWRTQKVHQILSDPVYTGTYMFGGRNYRNITILENNSEK